MSTLKLGNVHNSLFNFLKQNRGSYLFFFLLGLTLRGIPELLVSQYPVGYETITWYAPPIMTFPGRSVLDVFVQFFQSAPLFYVLMWLVSNVTGAHAFTILKVVGPILYGSLIISFFVFLKKGLKFEWKMAFVASLLLAFQIAALRDSWDRFRTVLALIFFFATLTALKSDSKHKWGAVTILAVLTALSREYVALVLFATVLGFIFFEKKDIIKSLVTLGPAFAIFVIMVNPGLLKYVSNYAPQGQSASRSYLWTVQDAFVIFAVCYLLLLPFVLRGLRKDRLIGSMTGWLLLSSFSVICPWFVILGYQRWLMLLVFPFSVYAAWGIEHFQLFNKRRIWMLMAIFLVFMLIGIGYSTGTFSYVGQMTNSYVAVNLVQSSISWDQIDDVKTVLAWLDEKAVHNSSILAEECFYGWALIYLERANQDVKIIPYAAASLPTSALEIALHNGFNRVYLIWYTEQGFSNFERIHSENAISVFQYAPKIA